MLLYLARHAQTASSAVDSFNGRRELPLTERGQQQARKLGQRLSAVRFAAVYRSPLGRTAQTAALIAPTLPAQVVPGLTEIDYGEWEGLSPERARERDRERYDAWVADPQAVSPPGGETATQVATTSGELTIGVRPLRERRLFQVDQRAAQLLICELH